MNGVINTKTRKIHKRGEREFESRCGATRHVSQDQLRPVIVDETLTGSSTSKCGRCFSDGGGY